MKNDKNMKITVYLSIYSKISQDKNKTIKWKVDKNRTKRLWKTNRGKKDDEEMMTGWQDDRMTHD